MSALEAARNRARLEFPEIHKRIEDERRARAWFSYWKKRLDYLPQGIARAVGSVDRGQR